MNQLELFNHWLNRIKAKYFYEELPLYDGDFDKEVFVPTQKNKPSPVGTLSYQQLLGLFDWKKLGLLKMTRSFCGWTNSMEPTFDHGDLLFKVPYDNWKASNGQLTIGQIAVYEYYGTRIVHRVIGKTPNGDYIFKGDNNKFPDPTVKESQIKDVIVGVLFTNTKITEKQD